MTIGRISTISVHQKTVSDISRVQYEMGKIRSQISSGREASDFKELGSKTIKVLDLESAIRGSNKFVKSNDVAINRLKTMDLIATDITEIARDMKSNIILEKSNSGSFDLKQFAENALKQLEGNLNKRDGNRAIFAGSKIDGDAVGNLVHVSNVLDGVPTANYYKGDAMTLSVKATSVLEIDYGINASDPAFTNLIGALHKAIELDNEGTESSFQEASKFIDDALDGLVNIRSSINSDIITLEGLNSQHLRFVQEFNSILSETIGVDVVEASINLSLNDAILTATMQTFAKVSNLTLSDFLR